MGMRRQSIVVQKQIDATELTRRLPLLVNCCAFSGQLPGACVLTL